jgi:endonuclease/exonuclease/phosphatase family metal-dependent hydrolase
MRLATYNVAWFDHLFDDDGRLRNDTGWSGLQDIDRASQTAALAQVFRAMDADLVMVIEAPDTNRRRSTVRALESFARAFGLRTTRAVHGFESQTQQEIAALYDPTRLTARHDPQGSPRFDGKWRQDVDRDGRAETVTWSKPPLELEVTTSAGRSLRLIGVHAKSKAPHGARTEDEARAISLDNRHKQIAQCLWLRARLDRHLGRGDPLIVMGDFNDGPGLDEYEAAFGRSGVEVVIGTGEQTRLFDPHVTQALSRRLAAMPATARFRLADGDFLSALLDYIMVSPDLAALKPVWRIWHPFDNAACFRDPALQGALLQASDHFPVTVDITL